MKDLHALLHVLYKLQNFDNLPSPTCPTSSKLSACVNSFTTGQTSKACQSSPRYVHMPRATNWMTCGTPTSFSSKALCINLGY